MNEGKFQIDAEVIAKPKNLFKPTSWLSKIDFINHLILFNNVLITVLAEKMGGKTSFLTLLQSSLDPQIKSGLIAITPPCNGQHLTQQIAEIFNLRIEFTTTMTSIIAQVNERKAHVLLMIDDAQYLPETWLNDLMDALKNQGNHGYFHLCLAADYSIVASLNKLAATQYTNLIHTIELGGLNEVEAKIFIAQRAQSENFTEKLITDDILLQIYKVTAGDLSKINANLSAYFKDSSYRHLAKQVKVIKRTVSTICLFALISGVTYGILNLGLLKNTPITRLMALLKSPEVKKEPKIKKAIPEDLFAENEMIFPSSIPNWQDAARHQNIMSSIPVKSEVIIDEDNLDEGNSDLVLMDKVIFIPKIKAVEAAVEAVQLASSIPSFPGFPQVQVADRIIPGGKGSYTIQLLASRKMEDLTQFINRYKLDGKTKISKVNSKGSMWYVLTMGEYKDFNLAKSEVNHLTPPLNKLNPWIRSTSSLHSIG